MPEFQPSDTEEVEITVETLRDLLGAYDSLTGGGPAASPQLTMNEAIGLILSYLPALIRLATVTLLEEEPQMELRNSIHELLDRPNLT